MVVGDGRMDVDVDVDVVMLVCGCEPGKGPLPGRAQPEVRHCSVTWYRPREGGKLEVLGLAGPSSPRRAHHDGWGELPKYHLRSDVLWSTMCACAIPANRRRPLLMFLTTGR